MCWGTLFYDVWSRSMTFDDSHTEKQWLPQRRQLKLQENSEAFNIVKGFLQQNSKL